MHIKRQTYRDLMRPLGPAMDDGEERIRESMTWPDFAEGVAAFQERRDPHFPALELS